MAGNSERVAAADSGIDAEFAAACGELFQGRENLAAVRGIPSEQLEALFRFCYQRYINGDYDNACRGFQLLCLYDHQNPRNWQGYGYSLLGLKDYEKAATSLAFGSLFLDEGSQAWGEARLHMAKALLHSGRDDVAGATLQELLTTASDPEIVSEAAVLNQALDARAAGAV